MIEKEDIEGILIRCIGVVDTLDDKIILKIISLSGVISRNNQSKM